jgi:UDP-N-acetyl-D-glucosamine dehydrogenase
LGYVGLPLSLAFAEKGFRVLGFDIDENKVIAINRGESYIRHIGPERLSSAQRTKQFSATTDYSRAADMDALILCVPTPLTRHREPDLSYVIGTVDAILPHLRSEQVLSLESTTYPGTTEEEICRRIENRGLRVGKDVFVVYSHEREDPGNKRFSTATIPKVVAGATPDCLAVGVLLYRAIVDHVVEVSSTAAAELTKLLENIYRAVNIGLVNEIKIIADRMGIDIWEVVEAAASKPFGFTPFYPGPGLGGHCIPIDPFYLTWRARAYGINTRFIELAGEINAAMPEWVIQKTMDALNRHGKPLKGSRVLVLGLAYKKNIDDVRESPSVRLLELLRAKGADYGYVDPYFPVFPKMRDHQFNLSSIPLTRKNLKESDCVIVATDHDNFDYDMIAEASQLIVDTRGRFRKDNPHILRA